ncbi:MAG: hypothetical protein IJX94_02480 [Clostridia bacterium]|nr:hypothetical protein [Clostridia bacterium]
MEKETKPMGRGSDRWLIALAVILLAAVGLSVMVLPKASFSERENRVLTTWRAPTAEELLTGQFAETLRDLYADQFPLRTTLTSWKAAAQITLGLGENNGILFGKDGYLIPRPTDAESETFRRTLGAMEDFFAETEGRGIPLCGLFVPRSAEVMSDCLPTLYARFSNTSTEESGWKALEACSFETVIPLEELRKGAREGRQTQYRTDHHWTTYGAYLAYRAVAPALGIVPKEEPFFRVETVSEDFLGSSYATAGCVAKQADSVELYRFEGEDRFVIRNEETGQTLEGFYDRSAIEGAGQYEVFLGGNYGRITVTEPAEQTRPRLLLIKDSYANSLIPFLALHFDLDVIDLRYYPRTVTELLDRNSYDRVLILQGIQTLIDEPSLAKLAR